ncbi:hypothetical protein LCGC14_0535750 [marine sediment metagenome]|uniref:N-acetyltransferase domain-containing protein n=1 Tax=marine sediment metagenome TaxID=412755 RepID=A0A0F9UFU7_9ZZZZ
MNLQPITLKEAMRFVNDNHRHHRAPQGGLFAIGLSERDIVIGVAIVGRPVARMLQNGYTAEVTRLCVKEGYYNACSMLYSACWRAARAMGYKRLITYILQSESGKSLEASGYKLVGEAGGGTWNREDRPRVDTHPTEQKKLFEVVKVKSGGAER